MYVKEITPPEGYTLDTDVYKRQEYLLRKEQPVRFLYESELYEITIKDVKLFPQGYSALALHPEYLKDVYKRQLSSLLMRNLL